MPYPSRTVDRFWSKVKKTRTCWVWTGGVGVSDYGRFSVTSNKEKSAHRMAWELANGPTPEGLQVLHTCDNKICVRLKHLFVGTHTDNMRDKKRKGRQYRPQGELHHRTKFSNEDVLQIRLLYKQGFTQPQLATQFGVYPSTINRIVNNKRWKHI